VSENILHTFTLTYNYFDSECNLPELGALLQNTRISASDSFTLSIQLHTPAGPHFPQQPQAYYVPKDLLDGLEASLDNASKPYLDIFFLILTKKKILETFSLSALSASTPLATQEQKSMPNLSKIRIRPHLAHPLLLRESASSMPIPTY
jgi:hypothetical protein